MMKHWKLVQTPEVSGLETLTEDLKQRIKFINNSIENLDLSDSSLVRSFDHLKIDVGRTLESTSDYLKRIKYERTDEEEKTIQAVIPATADAARLVFDKRFLELMKKATSSDGISLEDVEEITKGYIKKFQKDIDVSLPDPVVEIDARLKKMGDPCRPHFSQIKAENKFSATPNTLTSSSDILGKSVLTVGEEIKRGVLSNDVVNVGVFYYKGAWVCLNNRSLAAASVSQIQPRLEVIFPNEEFIKYYEAKKGGSKRPKQPVDLHSILLEDKSNKNAHSWPKVIVPPVWFKSPEEALAVEKKAASSASAASYFGTSYEKKSAEPKTLDERVLEEGDEEAGEVVEDSPLTPIKP